MNLFSFLQHKRKVALCISLPKKQEFTQCQSNVDGCLSQLRQLGVDVSTNVTPQMLCKASAYDVFIVIAHYEPTADALELSGGMMPISQFVNSLPANFHGVLDFSSCYSASAVEAIKRRCPSCHVQGALRQATLAFRLALYPTVIKLYLNEQEMEYHEAYKIVMKMAESMLSDNDDKKLQSGAPVKLGGQVSSIFAPAQVERGQPFLVQVFFCKDKDSDTAQLTAQRLDPHTGLMETQMLPVKLKLRDRLTVNLQVLGSNASMVSIDADTKSAFWMGTPVSVKFGVTISDSFSSNSFLCKIMMEVNREPVGESMFTIQVAEQVSTQETAEIILKSFDKEQEKRQAGENLRQTLLAQQKQLMQTDRSHLSPDQQEQLTANLQLCERCLQLMDEKSYCGGQSIKRVFISSTSDLASYREIARRKVEAAHMFPEMYEDWMQSGLSPRDVCCQKVLESDILLVILGQRYGFIEPSWNMSMTEIEYQTALTAGKTILAFILNEENNQGQADDSSLRQQHFINKVKRSRILKIVTDETSFADSASHDLLNHKNT